MSKEQLLKKWYIPAAVAGVIILIAVLVIFLALRGGGETYRSIRIVEMEGGVTIERDGVGNLEASVNMNLISNDYVRTDADSYVVLRLDDDKYVMLGEQGAMQVRAEGSAESGRTAIQLENGSVLSEIQNPLSQDSSYEIITPSATMSVRGTVFEVRKVTEGDSFELLVYEGKVAVRLGNLDPVLYTGGEYTQFTAGDAPQFLMERDVITGDRMNDQMLKRLQQIEENGRALEFGEVQLDELMEERSSSEGRMEVADNSQVKEPAASAEAPKPTTPAVQIPTETPTVSPTASPEPTATRRPAATAAPTATRRPATTAAPVATTEPSVTVEPETSEPEWDPEPGPAATDTPTVKPDPVQKQEWWTRADGQGNGSEMGPDGWKVVYFQPAIANIMVEDNVAKAEIGDQDPAGFGRETMKGEDSLKGYENHPSSQSVKIITIKEGTVTGEESVNLEFLGWFYEDKEGGWKEWDSKESPKSDLWLYSVWKDNANNMRYIPKIWRDPDTGFYRCYSVREDISKFIDKQTQDTLQD